MNEERKIIIAADSGIAIRSLESVFDSLARVIDGHYQDIIVMAQYRL